MEKRKIEKLECRYPTLFKIMWLSTIIWFVIGIANYFGHWLVQDKLDGFGESILFLFGISLFLCFGKGILNLLSQQGIKTIVVTKKVAKYAFIASFVVLLVISIWNLCRTTNNSPDFSRSMSVLPISTDAIDDIFGNLFKSAFVSIGIVIVYWYVRICFFLFAGRIRRLGGELAFGMMMLGYLAVSPKDQILVNVMVVLIACGFLYDIWRFADFKETSISMSQIKSWISEED